MTNNRKQSGPGPDTTRVVNRCHCHPATGYVCVPCELSQRVRTSRRLTREADQLRDAALVYADWQARYEERLSLPSVDQWHVEMQLHEATQALERAAMAFAMVTR